MQELRTLVKGQVLTDEESRKDVSGDFGRWITRIPQCVVRVSSAEDVAAVMKFAQPRGIPVATRGAAHSESGQALGNGIVLDMGGLNQVLAVDRKGLTATVEPGMEWRKVVEHLLPMGLLPRVLTNNLNASVGGTLSVAGLGVASFLYGAQGDNVEELQVVTPEGEIVDCSPDKNRDIFDAVRSTMGQLGIITRAKLKLRECLPNVRMHFVLYDDLAKFMSDSEMLIGEKRPTFYESWCVPSAQGLKRGPNGWRTFAEWFYPVQITMEYKDTPPDEKKVLAGLNFYRKTHVEDRTMHEFQTRLDPVFDLWKRGGAWDWAHPWMESVLPWDVTANYIQSVLADLEPQMLIGGHILLWPSSGLTSSIPWFMRPADKFVMGFGILPAIPHKFLEGGLKKLDDASDFSIAVGGKRYLSGYIKFDKDRWKMHFGDRWPELCALKKKMDPNFVLNPGFIDYDR
jgi:FAD/FMN-containing dehydrogenase